MNEIVDSRSCNASILIFQNKVNATQVRNNKCITSDLAQVIIGRLFLSTLIIFHMQRITTNLLT